MLPLQDPNNGANPLVCPNVEAEEPGMKGHKGLPTCEKADVNC